MLEVGNLASHAEDRSHFGAWCITSSPLILGHNVTDQVLNDELWDIIANTEAIAVNQAWAGHPGYLADSSTGLNGTSDEEVYAWAVDCDETDPQQLGWQILVENDGNGGTTTSRVCRLSTSNSNDDIDRNDDNDGELLCFDSSEGNAEMVLRLLTASSADSQAFTLNDDATITAACATSSSTCCLDVYNLVGPAVELYECNQQANQRWHLDDSPSAGSSSSSAGSMLRSDSNGLCVAARKGTNPSGTAVVQTWAKPLPEGKVAVLVLSSMPLDSSPVAVSLDLDSLLGLPPGSGVEIGLRDVWAHEDVDSGNTIFGTFITPLIDPHDSLFYILTPNEKSARI
jgi:hypothetical protein